MSNYLANIFELNRQFALIKASIELQREVVGDRLQCHCEARDGFRFNTYIRPNLSSKSLYSISAPISFVRFTNREHTLATVGKRAINSY